MTEELVLGQVDTVRASIRAQFGTAISETKEMWGAIVEMHQKVLNDPQAETILKSEYSMLTVTQIQFMDRTFRLYGILDRITERNRRIASKLNAFTETLNENRGAIQGLTPDLETALKTEIDTVGRYDPKSRLAEAVITVIAFAPTFYLRDTFAAYLDRPPVSSAVFDMFTAVAKNATIDYVSKSIPFLGPAVAIAEAVEKHNKERVTTFDSGIKQNTLFIKFQKSIEAGMKVLADTDLLIVGYEAFAQQLETEFDHAIARGTAILRNCG